MQLTANEIQIILSALKHKYGTGYSSIKAVGYLQANLSIMLEAATKTESK